MRKYLNLRKRGDNIKPRFDQDKSKRQKEGDGTMSAVTQNHVYSYGKERQTAKNEHVISSERLKEIKESLKKYRTKK